MSQVWEDPTITSQSELLVLLALADFANDSGEAWPSIERIATKSRHSDRGVQKIIDRLRKMGKIDVKKGGGPPGSPLSTNRYRILAPRVNPVHPPVNPVHPRGEPGGNGGVNLETGRGEPGDPPRSPDPSGSVSDPSLRSVSTIVQESLPGVPGTAEDVYAAYPRKVGKPKAMSAIEKQLKIFGFDAVIAATKRFSEAWKGETDLQFCPHPATWFNQERFNDKPETWRNGNGSPSHNGHTENPRNVGTCKSETNYGEVVKRRLASQAKARVDRQMAEAAAEASEAAGNG